MVIALSLMVAVLDGFGLAMFLPLLQGVSGQEAQLIQGSDKLAFLYELPARLGWPLNLWSILGLMCLFFVLKGVVVFVQGYHLILVRQLFIRSIRFHNLEGTGNLQFAAFASTDQGQLQNSLSGEVGRVSRSFKNYFDAIKNGVMLLVYLAFAYYINPIFASLIMGLGLLTYLGYHRIFRQTRIYSRDVTRWRNRYQNQLLQLSQHFRYLAATGLMTKYIHRLKTSVSQIEQKNRRLGFLSTLLLGLREPVIIIIVAAMILVQTQMLSIAMAVVLVSLLFFYRALISLGVTQSSWNNFLSLSGSLENIQAFEQWLRSNSSDVRQKKWDASIQTIEMVQVGFKYGNKPILRNIDLIITAGDKVRISGPSGIGKTTLVSMIAGLLTPSEGQVLVNGLDLQQFDLSSYQRQIGYVTQDPVVFNDTLFNNVTLWAEKTPAHLNRFAEVMEATCLREFMEDQPAGENVLLGMDGLTISGGQKQRIALARELFKEIDVLILDEAMSELDERTKEKIWDGMQKIEQEMIIIFVSHSAPSHPDIPMPLNRLTIQMSGDVHDLMPIAKGGQKKSPVIQESSL